MPVLGGGSIAHINTPPSFGVQKIVTVSDTVTITTTTKGGKIKSKSISEPGITVSAGTITKQRFAPRSLTETVAVTGTPVRSPKSFTRNVPAEPGIPVGLISLTGYRIKIKPPISQSITIASIVSVQRFVKRIQPAEVVPITTRITRSGSFTRKVSEPLVVIPLETFAKQKIKPRPLATETVAVVEALIGRAIFRYIPAGPEAANVFEALKRQTIRKVNFPVETLQVSEAISKAKRFPRNIVSAENVAVSDVPLAPPQRKRFGKPLQERSSVFDSFFFEVITTRAIYNWWQQQAVNLNFQSDMAVTPLLVPVNFTLNLSWQVGVYAVNLNLSWRIRKPNPTVADPDYARPMRPAIYIYSNDGTILNWYFNAFNPQYSFINIIGFEITAGSTVTGSFTITVEDSDMLIDRSRLQSAYIVIQLGKHPEELTNYMTGYIRKIKVERPDTNALIYTLSGYGAMIRFNERIADFQKIAREVPAMSTAQFFSGLSVRPLFPVSGLPQNILMGEEIAQAQGAATGTPGSDIVNFDTTDPRMRAFELALDLITNKDNWPLGGPVEVALDPNGVQANVDDFIPLVNEPIAEWATVMNDLADAGGFIWYVDQNGQVVVRYPYTVDSGIVIKDKVDPNDLSANTSHFVGGWSFEESIEKHEGFSNTVYGIAGTQSTQSASSLGFGNNSSLSLQNIAQRFIAGPEQFSNIALLLTRVGAGLYNPTPVGISQNPFFAIGGAIREDFSNSPEGALVATFEIPQQDIGQTPTPFYQLDITLVVPKSRIKAGHVYWIILYGSAIQVNNNDMLWANDGSTVAGVSATQDNSYDWWTNNPNPPAWKVSTTGPSYAIQIFKDVTHITVAADTISQNKYGVIESTLSVSNVNDDETLDRICSAVLKFSSRPKRTYEVKEITCPDQPIFPGTLVTIVDSMLGMTPDSPDAKAEVNEITYKFEINKGGLGTRTCEIKPIGYLDLINEEVGVPVPTGGGGIGGGSETSNSGDEQHG